jgi:LacI family transcriptional regulator
MKDVALRAGVSTSTVSLVVRGKDEAIPERTRQRVLAAVAELGYRPNALAAGLRRRTSETIGFVSDEIATTPHAGAMIQGAQDAAWAAGNVLLVTNTCGDAEVERKAIDAMLERQVDGVVYATMYHRVVIPPAALWEVPSVLLDARSDDLSFSSVAPDEEGGAYAATRLLLDEGHTRIGFVQSEVDIPAARERLSGYQAALLSRSIDFDPNLISFGQAEYTGGQTAGRAILERADRPTALFCFNDRMAAGVAYAARHLGLSIPTDLSLVGFDNEELVAPLIDPPLTTVQLPHNDMGRWAVEHLLELIADGAAPRQQYRAPCPLVVRESVSRPPTGRRTPGAHVDSGA